jgi:uncharacterized protein YebE (UPF0316 family)
MSAMLIEVASTAGLAMLSVGLWTVRVAVTARGSRALGALVAAVEATVFAVAFSRLLAGLDSPHRVAAYGLGVAAGTLLGLTLDSVLNPQTVRVDVVDTDHTLVATLDREGWPSTSAAGFGVTGPVSMVSITTNEARLQDLVELIGSASPAAFWTVTLVRRVRPVSLPHGYTQVAGRPAPSTSRASVDRSDAIPNVVGRLGGRGVLATLGPLTDGSVPGRHLATGGERHLAPEHREIRGERRRARELEQVLHRLPRAEGVEQP